MYHYPFVNVNFESNSRYLDDKTTLQLEVILHYDRLFQKSRSSMPRVCLRIGESRLYYIFNYEKFFEAFDNRAGCKFSESFTFHGKDYTFSPIDIRILALIRELFDIDYLFKTQQKTPSMYLPASIVEDKWVFLPEPYLIRLYELLRNKSFKIDFNTHKNNDIMYIEEIGDHLIDLNFHLSKEKESYLLTYNFPIYKLSHNLHYILFDGYIVHVSDEKAAALEVLFEGLYTTTNTLHIAHEKQEHFFSQVVPFIKKIGTLTLDPELQASIVEAPLHAEIYLDKKGANIFATILFNYGSYSIDPFHFTTDDQMPIILRDILKEDRILASLSDFVIKSDGLYLYNEDKAYGFLTDSLPALYELTDIFYTDAFKTIQINSSPTIRSKVSYLTTDNFLEFSFEVDSVDQSELHHLFQAIKLKKKYYRMQNGSYIGLDQGSLSSFATLLEQLQLNHSDLSKPSIKLPSYRAFILDDYSKTNHRFILKRQESFKTLIESINNPEEHEFECPPSLTSILRDYQHVGFKWLKTLAKFGFGGILADDMGLGKTLQTLAFIISEYESKKQPTLIITPTSLVYNWSEEIHKFLPDFNLLIIDGDPTTREQLISQSSNYPIIITSYPLLRRDIIHYESIQFSYCIIDEAQHIKNPKSMNAQSVKQIHANGYFALTGTPIENHLSELWSIFDFVMPRLLFSHNKFTTIYEAPIMKDNNKEILEQLKKIIRPFILRRLKSDVLKELPEKTETNVVATLYDQQKKLYLAHLEEAKSEVKSEIANNTYKQNHIKILSMITRLRQICCHPSMFIDNYEGGSGKLDLLLELISDSIDSNHRILLFSQFTSMLGIIRKHLDNLNISYAYLDGQIPSMKRKDVIHSFNHGEVPIFLISLKAGGTGLNLTKADIVIHYDPWWNPAVEDQATDRAYRIGQLRNVQVFKLLAKGTIEEKIFKLQQKKKQLANSVIESGESFINSLSVEDIRNLFDLD